MMVTLPDLLYNEARSFPEVDFIVPSSGTQDSSEQFSAISLSFHSNHGRGLGNVFDRRGEFFLQKVPKGQQNKRTTRDSPESRMFARVNNGGKNFDTRLKLRKLQASRRWNRGG